MPNPNLTRIVIEQVKEHYPKLPEHIIRHLRHCITHSGSVSGFYQAVMDNDLALAATRADLEHRRHLGDIADLYFRNTCLLKLDLCPNCNEPNCTSNVCTSILDNLDLADVRRNES